MKQKARAVGFKLLDSRMSQIAVTDTPFAEVHSSEGGELCGAFEQAHRNGQAWMGLDASPARDQLQSQHSPFYANLCT